MNTTNYSDICEFASVSAPLATWLTIFQATFCILSLSSSLLLNVSFTVVVIIHRALRDQKELVMCLVLTVSNICYSVIFSTFYLASLIYGEWPLGKTWCYVDGTILLFFALLRFTFILAVTVDRFGGVMYPFQFPQHSSKVAAVIFTVGGLHSAITSLLFNFKYFGCYRFQNFICVHQINCAERLCYVYIILQLLLVISSGIVAPLILNIIMFYKAKKLRTTVACGTIANVDITAGTGADASHDMRGMVTIALLLASIVGLTLPSTTMISAKSILSLPSEMIGSPISVLSVLFNDLYTLVPTADALVVWRNRDVKEYAMSLWRKARKIFKAAD